jgi:hypothetical protein
VRERALAGLEGRAVPFPSQTANQRRRIGRRLACGHADSQPGLEVGHLADFAVTGELDRPHRTPVMRSRAFLVDHRALIAWESDDLPIWVMTGERRRSDRRLHAARDCLDIARWSDIQGEASVRRGPAERIVSLRQTAEPLA